MKKLLSFTLLIAFFLVANQNATAQRLIHKNISNSGAKTWHVLGNAKVTGGGIDHDVIRVTGVNDNYRKLKFKVTNSGLNLIRMTVTYDVGAVEKINIRQNINKGGESRVIDLRGGKRSIRNIQFWYEDKGFLNGKAKVTVFGRR